jgi:hypothetical protein
MMPPQRQRFRRTGIVAIVTVVMSLLMVLQKTWTVAVVSAWAASSPNNQPRTLQGNKKISTERRRIWGTKPCSLHQIYRRGSHDTKRSAESTKESTDVPMIQNDMIHIENLGLLSDRGRAAIQNLILYDTDSHDQMHVYGNWPPPGVDDENKLRLAEQVR